MTKDIEKKYNDYANELFPIILDNSIKTIMKTKHFYETFFDIAVEEASEIDDPIMDASVDENEIFYENLEKLLKEYINSFVKKH